MTVVRKSPYGGKQHALIVAISDALITSAAPPLDERLKSIIASAVRHLLKGHYDFDLIRRVAVNLATTDPRKLAQLAVHVRAEQDRLNTDEHTLRMAAERLAFERNLPEQEREQAVALLAELRRAGKQISE